MMIKALLANTAKASYNDNSTQKVKSAVHFACCNCNNLSSVIPKTNMQDDQLN